MLYIFHFIFIVCILLLRVINIIYILLWFIHAETSNHHITYGLMIFQLVFILYIFLLIACNTNKNTIIYVLCVFHLHIICIIYLFTIALEQSAQDGASELSG